MITVTVRLPEDAGDMSTSMIVDSISVTALDDTVDRQPRSTFLEGIRTDTDEEEVVLTFTTY